MKSKAKLSVQAEPGKVSIIIKPPNFQEGLFEIKGNAPLVIHRFSAKTKAEMLAKAMAGPTAASRVRVKRDPVKDYHEARYISKEGWDGFNASSIRCAMIDACRVANFKMVLAKMSVFCIQDGWDATEPQIPLVRIWGCEPVRQDDMARTSTGEPYIAVRPAYHGWSSKIHLRWDADQFGTQDVANLLMRVGSQVGLGEGRPFSKNSAGMGWGTFDLVGHEK